MSVPCVRSSSPALPIDREPVPRRTTASAPKGGGTDEFEKLRAKVLAAARSGSGLGSLAYDEAGSLAVPVGSRTGWIRPFERPHFVRVHVHLLGEGDADAELQGRAHEVNARLSIARVICTEGSVFLGVDLPAVPFRPEHLAQAMTTLAQLADGVLRDLRPREEPGKVVN